MNGFRRAGTGAAAAVLCAALALVPAGLALAGYQEGGYAGSTEKAEALSFRATSERVKRLEAVVYAVCADGSRQRITVENGRTRIEQARFSLDLTGASDLEVSVSGKLRDDQASGRIKAIVKPPGTVCSADEHWQATLTPDAAKPGARAGSRSG